MTVSTDSLVLFAHILAAMVLVGSSLFAPLVLRAVRSAGSVAELRGWLDLGRRSSSGNPLAAMVLLGTGIWLGRIGWWTQAWFWVAVGSWLVNSTLAAAVVRRAATAVAIAAGRAGDGPVGAEVDRLRRSRAWILAEAMIGANDVAMLYVMIDKPALGPSLAILALANLVVLGSKLGPELLQRPGAPVSRTARVSSPVETHTAVRPTATEL